jgi:hypothetical protein
MHIRFYSLKRCASAEMSRSNSSTTPYPSSGTLFARRSVAIVHTWHDCLVRDHTYIHRHDSIPDPREWNFVRTLHPVILKQQREGDASECSVCCEMLNGRCSAPISSHQIDVEGASSSRVGRASCGMQCAALRKKDVCRDLRPSCHAEGP